MTAPEVTVVIPTFGRSRRLLECVEALDRQEFAGPWEIVVVDDGSPEPVEPLLSGRGEGPSIRVIRQQNAGPAAARNRGVAEARGGVVAFTDDDCRPEPGWLDALVDAVREREDALVGGTTFNGLPGDFFATMNQFILDLVYEHFNADPGAAYFLASNNVACSRARYLELGGFDAAFVLPGGEDRDFCDRWRGRGWPIVVRPAARVEHRHGQKLRQFFNLYIRYGRGAYIYQLRRSARGSGTMRDDIGFHGSLPRRVRSRLRHVPSVVTRLKVVAALVVWQVANAMGFVLEAVRHRCGRSGAT